MLQDRRYAYESRIDIRTPLWDAFPASFWAIVFVGLPAMLFILGMLGLVLGVGLTDPCPCSVIVPYNGTVANATTGGPPSIFPASPVTIAAFADQGLNSRAKAVMQLVRDQNASFVLHVGDFDYIQAPKCWAKQIFQVLANESFPASLVLPYFGVYGNHEFDKGRWPVHGYSRKLRDQLHPVPASCCCTGRVGVRATCIWQNVVLLQIGAGVTACFTRSQSQWIADELARLSDYGWKFCLFHTPKTEMQLGWAGNPEIGWDVYQACRQGGAIILNGHDHRYARTHLMSSFGPTQTIASTANQLNVSAGESFAVISGLGGYGIRRANPLLLANPWWAASLNKGDPQAGFGALFLRIGSSNVSGDTSMASATFETTDGNVVDFFTVQIV
jgi:hypothetical protein